MFGRTRSSLSRLSAATGAVVLTAAFMTVGLTPTALGVDEAPPEEPAPTSTLDEEPVDAPALQSSDSPETWQRQSVTPDASGWYSSLALDSQGRPHVAYRGTGSSQSPVMYAWYDGTTWRGAQSGTGPDNVSVLTGLGSSSTGYLLSMALDADGHPHIAYTTGRIVRHAVWTGSTWTTSDLATATGTLAASPSLAIDSSGGVHLSYIDATAGDTRTARGRVMYTSPGGPPAPVSPDGVVAYGYTSLALDGAGTPHVAYYDVTSTTAEQVSYASPAEGTWTPEKAADVATGTAFGSGLSLAMWNGSPRIAYSATFPTGSRLMYVGRDGAGWGTPTNLAPVTVGSTGTISLGVDNADVAHIAYYRSAIWYGTVSGASWTTSQLGDAGLQSYYPSLALSSSGKPRVTYFKRTDQPSSTHGPLVYAHLNRVTANDDTLSVPEDATEATAVDVVANDTQYAFSGPMTVTIATQPTHGTATVVGGAVSYRPTEADYNGPDSVVYQVCDGNGQPELCATATVSVTVEPVNDAPTCRDVAITTDEATPGSVTPDCTDPDGDPLTYTVSQPSMGTAGVADGKLTFSPDGDYSSLDTGDTDDSSGDFTYVASDGRAESNTAAVAVTVTGVNDAPVLDAFPAGAGGQYSDPVDGDTTLPDLQALRLSATDADDAAAELAFSVDASRCTGGEALPSALTLTDNGDGTATVSGRLDVPAGAYHPCVVVSDGEDVSQALLTITVTPEDARVVDFQPTFVRIDGTDADIDSVSLSARFVEVEDGYPSATLSSGAAAYAGTDVKLVLAPTGTNGTSGRSCVDTGVPTSGGSQLGCTVSDLAADGYEVDADVLGTWFDGIGVGTLAVFDPANGFATGGGELTWTTAPSPWTNAKVNFAFTGKKLNKNVQGSVLMVLHTAAGPYVVKTNSFTGLSNVKGAGSPEWWYTTMTGKATYAVPDGQTNPYCAPGVLKCGNFTVIMYAEDRGEPGAGVDTYKLKLIAPNGTTVFDMPLQKIAGGNVAVPHLTTK